MSFVGVSSQESVPIWPVILCLRNVTVVFKDMTFAKAGLLDRMFARELGDFGR